MSRYQSRPIFDDRHLAFLDVETVSGEEMEDGGFPPWPTHSPVICSILTADYDKYGVWHSRSKACALAKMRSHLIGSTNC